MNARQGFLRMKIVWAAVCIAVSAFVLFMLMHGVDGAHFGRMFLGVTVATAALAGLPFVTLPIDARVSIGIVAVWGGLAYAEGPGKWPEGLFISLVLAAVFYGCCWIVKGFVGKKTPNVKG